MTAPKAPQRLPLSNYGGEASNGPQIAPKREETALSYGDIADWLDEVTL